MIFGKAPWLFGLKNENQQGMVCWMACYGCFGDFRKAIQKLFETQHGRKRKGSDDCQGRLERSGVTASRVDEWVKNIAPIMKMEADGLVRCGNHQWFYWCAKWKHGDGWHRKNERPSQNVLWQLLRALSLFTLRHIQTRRTNTVFFKMLPKFFTIMTKFFIMLPKVFIIMTKSPSRQPPRIPYHQMSSKST